MWYSWRLRWYYELNVCVPHNSHVEAPTLNVAVQAYLGDTMGLVPDYCDKLNIAIKQVT